MKSGFSPKKKKRHTTIHRKTNIAQRKGWHLNGNVSIQRCGSLLQCKKAEDERSFTNHRIIVSYFGLCLGVLLVVQFEGASSSEPRSTWGRRWPRRSPLVARPASAHAPRNKSCPRQRSVPFVLGWRHSLYTCSTRGGGTCPSAWPWLPWGRNAEISSSLRRRISQRLKTLEFLALHCT